MDGVTAVKDVNNARMGLEIVHSHDSNTLILDDNN